MKRRRRWSLDNSSECHMKGCGYTTPCSESVVYTEIPKSLTETCISPVPIYFHSPLSEYSYMTNKQQRIVEWPLNHLRHWYIDYVWCKIRNSWRLVDNSRWLNNDKIYGKRFDHVTHVTVRESNYRVWSPKYYDGNWVSLHKM